MLYEIVNLSTGNWSGCFESEDEALREVRQAIDLNGRSSIDEFGLSSRDDLGQIEVIAEGEALAERALERFPQTVRPA